MLARDAFSYALPSANNRPMRKNAQPVLAFLVSEAYGHFPIGLAVTPNPLPLQDDRLSRISGVSLDIQESKVEPPQRHAKALQLWALGIGAVISGEYYGWQSSLVAGFNGMLIVMSMMTVLYVMLSFSLAELSATIPADAQGDPVNSSTFYTIYSYLQTLFNVDEKFAPVFFIAFGILFGGLNIYGVQASFRMQACSTALCVLLLLIMFFSAIPHLSYNQWVVEQNWKYTDLSSAIEAIPYAMWFYLGIEELPLASEETIEPEKNIPRGLFMCISTRGPFLRHGRVQLADCTGAARYELSDDLRHWSYHDVLQVDDGHSLCSSPNSYVFFMGQLLFAIAETDTTPNFSHMNTQAAARRWAHCSSAPSAAW
ncbi:Amino acid/polyamine transporter I [Phytophthora cactorum]|nr:Amino acid/polyamine transporter I [Phytophthora cactorum]